MARAKVKLDERQVAAIGKALAEPRRLQILRDLGKAEEALSCACLIEAQGISPGTMSHHLKELEHAGLIDMAREGKFARLTLKRDVLRAYTRQLREI